MFTVLKNEIDMHEKELRELRRLYLHGDISEDEYVKTKGYKEGVIDGLQFALEKAVGC